MRPLSAFGLHLAFEKDVAGDVFGVGDRPCFGQFARALGRVRRFALDRVPLGLVQ